MKLDFNKEDHNAFVAIGGISLLAIGVMLGASLSGPIPKEEIVSGKPGDMFVAEGTTTPHIIEDVKTKEEKEKEAPVAMPEEKSNKPCEVGSFYEYKG